MVLRRSCACPTPRRPSPRKRDAKQVEATHCYVGRRWQDVIGMYPPPAEVVCHRLRMNTFLGKWLEYLSERGHGVATLAPAPPRGDLPALPLREAAPQ